jgi:hypothetical protein
MTASTNLQLPYLAPGQAQKHVTVNETLRRLDAIVQISAVSATITAQPGSPADGAVYILPTAKTGADWSGMADGALAYYRDGAWEEFSPREGWLAFVRDIDRVLAWTGAAWMHLVGAGGGAAPFYEEGAFTPTFDCATPGDLSVAYTFQVGRYHRVGNRVWLDALVNCTPTWTTASGLIRLGGLPFTPRNATVSYYGALQASFSGTPTTGTIDVVSAILAGNTWAQVICQTATGGRTSQDIALAPSGAAFNYRYSISYERA